MVTPLQHTNGKVHRLHLARQLLQSLGILFKHCINHLVNELRTPTGACVTARIKPGFLFVLRVTRTDNFTRLPHVVFEMLYVLFTATTQSLLRGGKHVQAAAE